MKLHRLVLTNYRGIAHREIDFPDSGVVVVSGANEIGKSSMIEALDLLLESKDRSNRKDVKDVKPTHADVGSEVTAEISTGPYRFIYHKQFHKKAQTQLTVLAPRREQLTGDEAHERVRAILAETVDTQLWRAMRVLQSASTEAAELAGCDALSRALDIAAGDAATLSGTEPVLVERIDAEYLRYFTKTGRPTGEWANAIAALNDADTEVTRCTQLLAEVDDRVSRHAELTAHLAQLADDQQDAVAQHTAAKAAAGKLAELRDQLREAQLRAETAEANSSAAALAHGGRVRLGADLDTRTAVIATLDVEAATAAQEHSAASDAAAAAGTTAAAAEQTLTTATERVEGTRRVVDRIAQRDEAERLAARLAKIDAAHGGCGELDAELRQIVVTEATLRRIEAAAAAVDRAEASLAAISATVEFTATADLNLVIGGQPTPLPEGASWSTTVTAATEVEVPDLLSVRIIPADTTRDAHTTYAAAQQELSAALAAAGAADATAARDADQRRREMQGRRDQLAATVAALRGDDDIDQLRARLKQLQAEPFEPGAQTTLEDARAQRDTAEGLHTQVAADCEAARQAAAAALARLAETATRVTLLQDKLTGQRAERDAVAGQLAEQQVTVSDNDLAAAAATAEKLLLAARQREVELSHQVAAANPDAVDTELVKASAAVLAVSDRRTETTKLLHTVAGELAGIGTEGRKGKLDAAESAREYAAAEHDRVGRRARAVEMLRSVMARHRDTTRQRYVEPFRAEIQRLGQPVFGIDFEVDVDSDLRICSRTLDNRTVPYESLSGGAKEQLGILARLAGAALVAKEDSVPVLIDDALGFTDPDRLTKMGEVFDLVGAHGQVIVLTCTPARYDSVEGAHRIELSA